ncbi:aminotransferase class V-fold PLP-dependent enzyme [uncultured Bilophila sp.]|uniref:aminotransferase class V-fold PLP-dependent enzyme n=1 Tax=uncultured Bilophila sp. TaxID=529385 RepID=UPI0034A07760
MIPITCALNPLSGREASMPAVPKAETPRRVAVVGAGPAGLMAAAERGHEVILLERSDRHGGQINLAAVPPHKDNLRFISDYLYRKAQRAGVAFRFSCGATPESVRELSPDAVIVATGSLPVIPRFCASAAGAVPAQDILSGAEAGENVLVLGGGLIGCETAEYLATRGRSVTVVEMLPQLAKDMEWCARVLLLRRMASLGINLRPGNEILSIGADNAVTVRNEKGREDPLSCFDTLVVAVGYASNAVGTINDVARISRRCREVGALLSVDAVHIAPHKAIDMDAIGADMLFCSAYKFFGGHIGIAAVRKSVFEALDTYRLHPAPSTAPGKLETGTQSHEAIASIVPAVDFIAGLGTGSTRRERLVSGFERIERHENGLADIIRQGLADVPNLKLYQSEGPKTATVAFTLEGRQPGDVCRKLCDRYGIFAADGDYYAETLAHRVGVDRIGGWVRVGFAPYNTEEEAELLVRAVREIAAG